MEIERSLKIMNLSINYTSEELQNSFKKLILIYHPDRSLKNREFNTKKFIEIKDAYNILKEYELKENKIDDNNYNRVENILENIFEASINRIKKITKNVIIKKKINVDINNLIDKDIFILEYNNEKLYIPMWHHELVFEIENKKIVIYCDKKINNNMIIDDDNNIFVKVFVKLENLKNKKDINVKISKNLELNIDSSKLYLRKNQLVIFKNKGIPIINEKNIYFEETLSDIYVDLTIINLV